MITLAHAIQLNTESEKSLRSHKFPEHADAIQLGIEALKAVKKMRHYPFPDEILRLPGESNLPDLAPSADRKQRLRESPLGREPKG